jgi:hypothetical protein
MRRLPFIILIFCSQIIYSQSPHGGDFDIDCNYCHNTDGWDVIQSEIDFDHSETKFKLFGQHNSVSCRDCHESLVFNKANSQCVDCHLDMHEGTLGNDCASCHKSDSWLVSNIIEIHQLSRFPLLGNHALADCQQCHLSSSNLRYEPIGIECIDCHSSDYAQTKNPNHTAAGFSTDCFECHEVTGREWSSTNIAHDFFPLTNAHAISNCFECHSTTTYSGLDPNCFSCHENDYNSTASPNHSALTFSTNCEECHTTVPGWKPASFVQHDQVFELLGAHSAIRNNCQSCHNAAYTNTPTECFGCHLDDYNSTIDPNHSASNFSTDCETCHTQTAWIPSTFDHDNQYFPILSGKHNNQWQSCSDCHVNQNDFATFECITCHEHNQTDMDDKHSGINGYLYQSQACFDCHPTGDSEGAFNHSTSNFPLTGAHIGTNCSDCHAAGFAGTSAICSDCHTENFNSATNPNHQSLGINTNCETCHTTQPGWAPAQFPDHDNFYLLAGAHISIKNDCTTCHNENYTTTPNQCFDCHQTDYQNAMNPQHQSAGFNTDCETCHSEDAWIPSSFDHDVQYFPVYSGSHNEAWTRCTDCHTVQSDFGLFSCTDCHEHNQIDMDDKHSGLNTYVYQTDACYECHPNGEKEGAFDHSTSNFPLTGSHVGLGCAECHASGFSGTSNICSDCHLDDFNNSINPNHSSLGLELQCETCHTTQPGWTPALFPNHNNIYLITGAHTSISTDCNSCHNQDYNNTPNECFGCHEADYQSALNPPHQSSGFNTVCEDCHTQTAWIPSTFDHDNQFFPIYSGKHKDEWNNCVDCHLNQSDFGDFSCIDCHEHNRTDTDNDHSEVQDYVYASWACYDCHPNGENKTIAPKIKMFRSMDRK